MPVRDAFNSAASFDDVPEPEQAGAKGKQRRKAPAPFSLRLTFEERAALAAAAGAEPLGCYIRRRILGDDVAYARRHRRAPVQDHEALGRVLGALGQSTLASNLNQLAKAVNSGTLEITPASEQAIRDACADVQRMRAELLRALGLPAETP